MLIGHSWADLKGTILQIDEPVADLLRRRRRDIEGVSYLSITCPADRSRNAAIISTLRLGAGPQSIRKRYLAGDGGEIWVTLHTARIGNNGANDHLVGTFVVDQDTEVPRRLWQRAKQMLVFHDMRAKTFGARLMTERSWLILLHIYVAEAEGRTMQLSEIAQSTNSGLGLTRTWIKALVHSGFVSLLASNAEIVELTQAGISKLELLLSASLDMDA